MTDNYARHRETGKYAFFSGTLPAETRPADEWTFFALPAGALTRIFGGYLVGESPDVRCVRLYHAPRAKQCGCSKTEAAT